MRMHPVLATLALFGLVSTSSAAEIYKDYVPSKAVWNVTMVKVTPSRIDDYLGGLRQSWVGGCEISKKMGMIEECSIFVSETSAGGPFNVMLVQKFANPALREPDEARYNAFMAEFRKSMDKAKEDQLVLGYEEFRSFFGEMDFRRIEWK